MPRQISHTAALVLAATLGAAAQADITLIGKASIPGDATDKSALPTPPGSSSPADRLGSFGSAIAYTGSGNRFVAADDRGPGNGGVAWPCRFQTFDIEVNPSATEPVTVKLVATTLLKAVGGEPLVGNTGAYDLHLQPKGLRFDPEGIRIGPKSTLYISDEYGPWIDEFSMDGRQLRRIVPPAKFLIQTPDGDPAREQPPSNTKGRQPNHGFEGLAMTPDGAKLYAILQGPLIQDGALDPAGKKAGRNCRILEVTLANGSTRELVYPLESAKTGVNELLAINNHEFLALERDGKAGDEAKFRKIFRIDIDGCKDVSATESLPSEPMPSGVASKSLFLDLCDPRFGLTGPQMPEKIEGLAWGKDLPDGRHTLIVTTDNDLKPDQPSWFWVFAVDASNVPGLAPLHPPAAPTAR